MGNCCGQPIDNKGVKAPRRDPDSPVQLAKETYCAMPALDRCLGLPGRVSL